MAVFAVTTAKGLHWDRARGIRDQRGWDEHAAYFDELVEKGHVILGGPISSNGDDDDDVGLLAVDAIDEEQLRSLFKGDPWNTSGVLRIKDVRPWSLWLDSRR